MVSRDISLIESLLLWITVNDKECNTTENTAVSFSFILVCNTLKYSSKKNILFSKAKCTPYKAINSFCICMEFESIEHNQQAKEIQLCTLLHSGQLNEYIQGILIIINFF